MAGGCFLVSYIAMLTTAVMLIPATSGQGHGKQPLLAVTCPRLSPSASCMTVTVSSYYVNGIASYSCATGYQLTGSSRRTCGVDGTWSPGKPSCQRWSQSAVTCPRLSPSAICMTVTVSSYYVNGIASYSCATGYQLTGSSRRTCGVDGTWSPGEPLCQPMTCPRLSPSAICMTVTVSSYYVNGIASYSCATGYQLTGSSRRTCGVDGTWSPGEPSCQPVTCPRLSPSAICMTVTVSYYYVNGIASYSCATGYQLTGSSRRTCGVDGTWSPGEPSCQRSALRVVTCPTLSNLTNGFVFQSSYRHFAGDIATYVCRQGSKLIGLATRTCQSNGQWSGSQPSCPRLRCPNLDDPLNGNVSVKSYFTNGVAEYSCVDGYRLEGSSFRICQNNETWNKLEPVCSRIICPNITDPTNGTVSVSSYFVGGEASFSCLPTHYMMGHPILTCEGNGTWSGPKPLCLEKCVPSFGFVQTFLSIREGETRTVCVANCSCSVTSSFTVELTVSSQTDGGDISNDLIIPVTVELGNHSMCFNVTAVDDDLLEGYEPGFIVLHKPLEEEFEFCTDKTVLPISIVDNDELTIGFERMSISVDEGVGQMEACVVVLEPDASVPIPDVELNLSTSPLGSAKHGSDYTPIVNIPLSFSESRRKVCFNIEIIEDNFIENDESFSINIARSPTVDPQVLLLIEPVTMTVNILNNDGVNLGFETFSMEVEEKDHKIIVCIEARFSGPDVVDDFSLNVQSRSLLATEGDDYKRINIDIGPFNHLLSKRCLDITIKGDKDVESDEKFTLTIRGEPPNVMVQPKVLVVTITDDDEKLSSCDNPLRRVFPELFKHCSNCTYTSEWSDWEEASQGRVEVPKEICLSREMGVRVRQKNATTLACQPKEEKQQYCIPSKGEKMLKTLGVGNNFNSGTVTATPVKAIPKPGSKNKRQTSQNQPRCYDSNDVPFLYPDQCRAFGSCQYAQEKPRSRDPLKSCVKRSVLFVVDASGSIGKTLFQEIADSLSRLVKNLCGDIQFGLLKFSSGAYLEFCFNCYSNNQRDELQSRIRSTKYIGETSFTGYATKCAHNFMFDSSCGQHEDRCIDIVYVTDGDSSDSAFFNVCDEIECMHKNPDISDRLRVYAVSVGKNTRNELECITKYSKLSDNEPPIFSFEDIDELVVELNKVIRVIDLDQHKFRVSGEKPTYQCTDWINGGNFD